MLAFSTPASAAPYPPSKVIKGITFDVSTYRAGGFGGDLWPVTQTKSGALITAWGDGALGKCPRVSWGAARVAAGAPNTKLTALSCGPGGAQTGKMMSVVGVGSVLYGRMLPQSKSTAKSRGIIKSVDGGHTWTADPVPGERRLIFAQFGAGNAGAPGGYVYAIEVIGTSVHLRRVVATKVQDEAAYEVFSGTATSPAWSKSSAASRAIFLDSSGVRYPSLTWNPGKRRFLLAAGRGGAAVSFPRIGVFDAPNLWGPWTTAHYTDKFMGAAGGLFLSLNFPPQWSVGNTSWATFSCHNYTSPGGCGRYHDEFSIVKATLH
jgi:hypothetical protein